MKVHKISNNQFSFKSGLTQDILFAEKKVEVKKLEKIFADNYGIETNFLENPSAALANKLCLDIFNDIATKFNMTLTVPPTIYLYDKKQLINNEPAINFCISDTREVLKNEYPFPGRTIFFGNFKNLGEIDNDTEFLNKKQINSSSHFLAPFIHEWLHSFQLDYIFRNFGYGGDCDYLKEIYPTKQNRITGVQLLKILESKVLLPKENEIIYETIGKYSTQPINQYLEIFSETFTKFICNSLKNGRLNNNPFEQIKKTSPEFQKILHKVCLFK